MKKIIVLLLAPIFLSACQTDGNTVAGKTIGGIATYSSEYTETQKPNFNAFIFLPKFTKVTRTSRASHATQTEKFYQGGIYTLNIEHTPSGNFNQQTDQYLKNKDSFVQYLRKSNSSSLADNVVFIKTRNGYGFKAENENCVAARYGKNLKGNSSFQQGKFDTIIKLFTCKGLNVSVEEFVQRVDFSSPNQFYSFQNEAKSANNPSISTKHNNEQKSLTIKSRSKINSKATDNKGTIVSKLKRLKNLLNEGVITQSDYDKKKDQLLSEL